MTVEKFLLENNVEFKKIEHAPVFTCEDSDNEKLYKKLIGIHSKTLFLKTKKSNKFFLVLIPSNKKLDSKIFVKKFKEKISFASEIDLKNKLGLTPGSVSPFGLINNKEKDVQVFIHEDILNSDYVNFHPNINTATLNLSQVEFRKFFDKINIKFEKI